MTTKRYLGDGVMTAEQRARDLLERMGVSDAQSFTSGDLVELCNLIAEVERLRALNVVMLDALASAVDGSWGETAALLEAAIAEAQKATTP